MQSVIIQSYKCLTKLDDPEGHFNTHNTNIVLYLLMAQTKRGPFWYVMIHLLVIKASRDCFSQIKSFKESQNFILYFVNCPYKLDSRDVCTRYLNF